MEPVLLRGRLARRLLVPARRHAGRTRPPSPGRAYLHRQQAALVPDSARRAALRGILQHQGGLAEEQPGPDGALLAGPLNRGCRFLRNEPTQRRIPQFGGGAARGAAGNEITIHILSPELRSSISAWTVRRSCAANLTTSSIARNAGSCYDEVSLIEQCRDAGL